ncbi:Ig-like domain-containing protein [Cellulomonas sp. URHD0024]|uniref:Ig-like domain-containing protein n=1 Tax=Cellulomonas sp. URHD0024 TaxID=1302620 RepID=UPI0018C90B0D|nr:Ig-like domain-containing protein [Cellulomonas sp. URHD0024]
MRRADRPNRVPASLAALALVVPLSLFALAPPPVTEVAHARVAEDVRGSAEPELSAAEPVASATALSLSSGVTVFGLPVSARVTVTAPGATPSGEVEVLVDGTAVGRGRLGADGTVRVPLPATVEVGRHSVTAGYTGGPAVVPSSTAARTLTVTRTLPTVRTDGTDWSVGRSKPKAIRIQVTGFAGVPPTGTVVVWVNGVRKGSAILDRFGQADVRLASSTKNSVVVVTYAGDATFVPWAASPHLLIVR